jgi:hypothetical protein
MEPWQKLIQALCEIWVEEDIKSGKFINEERAENNNTEKESGRVEGQYAST